MHELVPIVYVIWIAVVLVCFERLRPALATAICLVGGWALLPTAPYSSWLGSGLRPNWVTGVALHSPLIVNKATVIGLAGLLGAVLFARPWLREVRASWVDAPIVIWCLIPGLSAFTNGEEVIQTVAQIVYYCLAWGAPYLLGRAFLTSREGLRTLLSAFATAGLLYTPLCIMENIFGPAVYTALYEWHPFETVGMRRYLGFRPLGFLEDGNQLGMWMATAALAATGLSRLEPARRLARLPIRAVSGSLIATTLLCQSMGGIILMLVGLLGLSRIGRPAMRTILIGLVGLLVGYVAIRATGVVSLRDLSKNTEFGREVKRIVYSAGRGSIGWRWNLEELHLQKAIERPILGWGRWDWWEHDSRSRPWGLWILVLGRYGMLGLLALLAMILMVPLRQRPRGTTGATTRVIALLLLLNFTDALLNSAFLLPLAAGASALARPHARSARPPGGQPVPVADERRVTD